MKLHSIVDHITNSSSTVFIWVTDQAITKTKEMLQKFLSMAGIKDNVDDLFDVKIQLQDDFFDNLYIRCSDEWDQFVEAQGLGLDIRDQKVEADFIAFMRESIEMGSLEIDYNDDPNDYKTIIVKSKKTGETIDMYNLMFSLFGVEGGYDG